MNQVEADIPLYNLAIVGFGNVGRALLRLLVAKETEMRRRYDVRWRLTGVATRRAGWVADPDGLNPIALLNGHWPAHARISANPQNVPNGWNRLAPMFFSKPVR